MSELRENGPDSEARRAWRDLLGALAEIDADWIGPQRGLSPGREHLGIRGLAMALWGALDLYLENEPERPHFVRLISPYRKWGDNPDAIYFFAPLRGDLTYRVQGRRGREVYLSLTVHGGDRDGHWPTRVVGELNMDDMAFDEDGSFEVALSPDAHEGNWMELAEDAGSVVVRFYFNEAQAASAEPELVPDLRIETVGGPDQIPVPDDETVARRLRRVEAWVCSKFGGQMLGPQPRRRPTWYSEVPNTMGPPVDWTDGDGGGWGAVDIAYSAGEYELAPDEALVMEGRLPEGLFTNVVIWNELGQTADYLEHTVSLNDAQMETDADRRYRVVIAHRDPGVPNWLDACGEPRAAVFWRFMLPAEPPEAPVCTVMPVDRVAETH